jgi:molecular chaperone GrpE
MSETTRRGQNAGASGMDPLVDAETDLDPKRRDRGGPDAQAGQDQPFGKEGASESLAQVKQERDELKEQLLRARAEFANYQKRAKQQADSDRVYAVGSLARDLLDPLDNLERAIEALRASATLGVTAGLDMVQRQLMETLAKHGVEPISALERPFDPNLHDAVMQQPSREHPEGTVVSELSKGYTIRDRVLRPSKVAVSAKPALE